MKHQTDPTPRAHGLDGLYDALRRLGIARASDGRWFAGVAAGVARRLGVDPLVIRAALILLGLLFGVGLAVYFVLWLILPDERGRISLEQALKYGEGHSIFLLIVTAIVVVGGGPWFGQERGGGIRFFGFLALAVGTWWFLTRTDSGRDMWRSVRTSWAPQPSSGQGGDTASPSAGASAGTSGSPLASPTSSGGVAVGMSTGNAAAHAGATSWPPPSAHPSIPVTVAVPTPRGERTRGVGFAGGLLILGASILAAVGVASAADRLSWQGSHLAVGIAAGLTVLGVGIVMAGIAGRRAGWLAPFALVAMVASLFATVMPHGLTQPFSVGERRHEPTALVEGQSYQLGAGRLDLDLTRADLSGPGVEQVRATVGLGELNLVVPEDVRVTVNASGRAGEILAEGSNEGGARTSRGGTALEETFTFGPVGAEDAIVIDAEVGLGEITIRTGAGQ
ncbi:PspC domain-containing protein [Intrasporangium sp. DVR]|uniref:PspC domain-containing protein n=1 Tax=Intrasporangium sp. DVR TaxID=3127867 RepID=UPI00313A7347